MSLHDIRLSRGNHSNWRRSQSSNSPQSLYIDTHHHHLWPVKEEDETCEAFPTTTERSSSRNSIFRTTSDTTLEHHRDNYYHCNNDYDEIDDDYDEYAAKIREEMKRLHRSLRWGTFGINTTSSPTMQGKQQLQQQEQQEVNNFIETMCVNIESHLSIDETMSSTDSHQEFTKEKALLSEEESIRSQLRIKEEEINNLYYKLSILEQTTNKDAQRINTLQMENSKLKERYYYQIAKMTASHANNLKELEMRYDSHWRR
jgi:hypothetical protein